MAGVLGGELAETFGQTLLDIIGPPGALSGGACRARRRRVRVRAAAVDHVRGRRRHQRHTARSDRPRAGVAAMKQPVPITPPVTSLEEPPMPARQPLAEITADRLTSLFRPSSVALVGASDKSTFSMLAYRNLVDFGLADRTYLVNRRGAVTHGQPTVRSCAEIGEPVDVAFLMVPQAGTLEALDDAAAAGIRNAVVLSAGVRRGGGGGARRAGRARRARRVARHDPARPEPPRVRQPHRRRPGLLDPRPAEGRRPGRPAVAERRELLGDGRVRGDGQRRALLPGHPRQRGDDHRRARPRLPGRRPGDPGGRDLHGDRPRS